MVRRLVISLILAVIVFALQLLLGQTAAGIALISGLIAFVVAFLVLLVSDRWFTRTGR